MRYLLDTNIITFMMSGSILDELHRDVRKIVFDYGNQIYTSSLSIMELIYLFKNEKIGIKAKTPSEVYKTITEILHISILHTKLEHINTYLNLKTAPDHKDQIDQMIISQAITEKISLVSSDRRFKEYKDLDLVFNKR